MNDNDNSSVKATTASGLVTSSLFTCLIAALTAKGVLSHSEVHEIYENALLSLEENQACAGNQGFAEACADARHIIEDALNNMANKYGTPDA